MDTHFSLKLTLWSCLELFEAIGFAGAAGRGVASPCVDSSMGYTRLV